MKACFARTPPVHPPASRARLAVAFIGITVIGTSCGTTPPGQEDSIAGLIYHKVVKQPRATSWSDERVEKPGLLSRGGVVVRHMDAQEAPAELIPLYYRTSPGDLLAFSFYRKPPDDQFQEYRISPLDVLSIHVEGHDKYSTDLTVRMDGKISFFQIGDVNVRGRTVAEVRQLLSDEFARVIPAADISVFLREGGVLLQDFLSTLMSNQTAGSTRIARVRPDGHINFALVGDQYLVGKSLPEMSRDLEDAYNVFFGGQLSVSVNMVSSPKANVAILGEIARPGVYTLDSEVHPLYALAMAGGALYTAGLDKAVLVKQTRDGRVRRFQISLDPKDTPTGRMDLMVGPYDMLIVPRSTITDVNLFVEQYIRQLIPVDVGFGIIYNLN